MRSLANEGDFGTNSICSRGRPHNVSPTTKRTNSGEVHQFYDIPQNVKLREAQSIIKVKAGLKGVIRSRPIEREQSPYPEELIFMQLGAKITGLSEFTSQGVPSNTSPHCHRLTAKKVNGLKYQQATRYEGSMKAISCLN